MLVPGLRSLARQGRVERMIWPRRGLRYHGGLSSWKSHRGAGEPSSRLFPFSSSSSLCFLPRSRSRPSSSLLSADKRSSSTFSYHRRFALPLILFVLSVGTKRRLGSTRSSSLSNHAVVFPLFPFLSVPRGSFSFLFCFSLLLPV